MSLRPSSNSYRAALRTKKMKQQRVFEFGSFGRDSTEGLMKCSRDNQGLKLSSQQGGLDAWHGREYLLAGGLILPPSDRICTSSPLVVELAAASSLYSFPASSSLLQSLHWPAQGIRTRKRLSRRVRHYRFPLPSRFSEIGLRLKFIFPTNPSISIFKLVTIIFFIFTT